MNLTRKKSKSIYVGISILLVLIVALSCAVSMVFRTGDDGFALADATAVGPGTASVLNLNDKGIAQDYFSKIITGAQNEYIYFGTNVSSSTADTPGYLNIHDGAVKWRVLSVNSTKYDSTGSSWLLWGDYRVGCGSYNYRHTNPYYAFWGNSMIRAKLNGGKYQASVSNNSAVPSYNQEVNIEDSWFSAMFTRTEEKNSFVRATSYDTWCGGNVSNVSTNRHIFTQNIIGSANNIYNLTLLTNARNNGANVNAVTDSDVTDAVLEVNSGDYLFFIDYDDINNTLFGFGDVAKQYSSAWSSSKIDGYWTCLTSSTITAEYLKEDTAEHAGTRSPYWCLRPANIYDSNKHSTAVGVDGGRGRFDLVYVDEDGGTPGVRPAFNFSPANVIYATAASLPAVGAGFGAVNTVADAKPAYKVYLKKDGAGYTNYNIGTHADMPKLTTGDGSTVKIEKTGQTGSAVFLLADPSGNGEVKYQATASFSGGVATASLPGGVKASDYVVTVLFLDGTARGTNYSEIVTASYTGWTVPEDKATTNVKYYNGSNLTFDLSYADGDCLEVTSLTYAGLDNVTTLPAGSTTSFGGGKCTLTAKEVGKYTVKIKPKTGKYWFDGTQDEKEYIFYIKHKVPDPIFTSNNSNTLTTPIYNKTEQEFYLNSVKDYVKILPITDLTADLTGSTIALKAKLAKTYNVTAQLQDKDLMEWNTVGDTVDKPLTLTINKLTVAKPSLTTAADSTTGREYVSSTSPVTFAMSNMGGYTAGDVTITLQPTSPTGGSVDGTSLKATNVGTYIFDVALADTDNTEWNVTGGGAQAYTISVKITRKNVDVLEFMGNAGTKTYNGSDQTFSLTWDPDLIDIKDENNAVVTSITKKNAGEYTYTMHLKDTANMQWKDTNADVAAKDLKFTMDKKALSISISCNQPLQGTVPTWEQGTKDAIFTVVIADSSIAVSTDTVKLKAYIQFNGNKSYAFDKIEETPETRTLEATAPDYLTPGQYLFGVELATADSTNANDNYKLPTTASSYTKNFNVKGQGLSLTADNMPWRCKYFDTKDNLEIPVDIMNNEGHITGKAKVTYNGFEYEFYVDTEQLGNLGAEIDTSKGTNGFDGDLKWTNATSASKTITFYWKSAEGYDEDSGSFTLTYDIEKGKYDLTKAKWDYVTALEYDPLQFRTVQVIDLPDGLTISSPADYSGNRYKPAGHYTAKVENIQNSNDNYYTPSFSDKTTYLYNDEEFPWSLEWEIAPKKLTLNWVEKNSDNNDFVYFVVNGDEAERIDSYLYYKSADYDNTTGTATGSPIALGDIEVHSKQVDAYWAVAVLKDPNNYEIESNKAKRFTVGSYKEIVKVELADKKPFIYNGNQYGKDIIVSSDDNTLTSANILKKYYKDSVSDENLLTDAPTDAGKYILVMSLQGVSDDDYELIIKNIEFEIEKAKIVATWNTEGNIPKLSNADNYKDIIGYEYYDSDGNLLADGAELEVGKSYKVKAILKGNYGDNYEFVEEDGETVLENPTVTDEQEFTLTQTNQGQGGNVGTGGGDENIIGKLLASNFPLWQIITMAVSGLLSIVFMILAIQYSNKAKKARGDAKKISSKAYAALLPVFDSTVVLAGLSNKIWSIIAFALVGVTALMFVIALVMRKSWKKAELAKETAMEERDERRFNNGNAQSNNDLKELKEQLALMSSQHNSNSNQNSSAESMLLIEQMRREMENQRREDEERHRREMEEREARYREEQAKHDEAMKMMLAGFMGSRMQDDEGNTLYGSLDDTDLLVQRVIAGLLPAVQQMIPEQTAYLSAPAYEQSSQNLDELAQMVADKINIPTAVAYDNSSEIQAMTDEMNALRQQIEDLSHQPIAVASDNSGDMKAMADEMNAMRRQIAMLSQNQYDMSVLDEEDEDWFDDDEEEWDSILDDDEDDNFVESVIIEADGTVRKISPNFRMRLKESSDQNREWYTAVKNLFCSQKGVTYRVCKRVEKIRYQGQVIGVIGIAKRSIKLWLALKPYEYDARRYHQKDVSDKPRFVDVPMYVRVGSDRALERAQELILALFQEFNMEARKRYHDRGIQELIFTLKHNKLLTNKYNKNLLREIVHVHDCNVLDDETAQKCVETKNVDFIDDSVVETVKLDDIDARFLDGNRVTLEKLKRVGLVSNECTAVNIVADKRLTKPLIVVANDFSLTAVKLIVLTGGRAIKLAQV